MLQINSFILFVQLAAAQAAVRHTWRGRAAGFNSIAGFLEGFHSDEELNGRIRIVCVCVCVCFGFFFRGAKGHFFGEDRGAGRLLWKIKEILGNILRATKYSVCRGKRPE